MLLNIQVLRLVAALLIVLVHANVVTEAAAWSPHVVSMFPVGTDLFLVTSAFLTLYVSRRSPRTGKAFFIHRLARIVPFYWFVTILVSILALALPSLFNSTTVTPETLLKSLFFIPYAKSNGLNQPIVFVAWTLSYLVLFAGVYAASVAASSIKKAPYITLAVLISLAMVGYMIQFNFVPLDFYTAPYLLDLAFGVAIFIIYDRLKAMAPKLWVGGVILAVSALAISARVFMPEGLLEIRPLINGLPAAGILVGALIFEWRGLRLNHPIVHLLANATFGIYLTHFFVTQVGNKIVDKFDLGTLVSWVLVIAVIVGAIVVGIVTHLVVEKPLTKTTVGLVNTKLQTKAVA